MEYTSSFKKKNSEQQNSHFSKENNCGFLNKKITNINNGVIITNLNTSERTGENNYSIDKNLDVECIDDKSQLNKLDNVNKILSTVKHSNSHVSNFKQKAFSFNVKNSNSDLVLENKVNSNLISKLDERVSIVNATADRLDQSINNFTCDLSVFKKKNCSSSKLHNFSVENVHSTYNTFTENFLQTASLSSSLPAFINNSKNSNNFEENSKNNTCSYQTLDFFQNFFCRTVSPDKKMTVLNSLETENSKLESISRSNSGYLSSQGIQLKQNLGLLNGICIIVGVIVGSGIFISPKGVLETSHSVGLSLTIWIACGVLSLIGALCYAELGTAIPKSGGDYAYIKEAFGDLPAFLFLWVATLIIMPTGNAIAALTFSSYVLVPYYKYSGCGDPPELAIQLIAVILVCFLTFINCYNVKWSAFLMDTFTFAKVFALIIIIGVGLWQIIEGKTHNFENMWQGSSTSPQHIALSFYSGLFSYAGWNFLNFVTEELKDPFKTLPKAIYISLPLVTIIYVLANIAYFTVLSPAEIIHSNAVAITFGNRVLGIFSWTMPLFVIMSTFGGLNGSIFTSSRLFFVGARNGHLPRVLGQINVHYYTPVPSLLFMCFTTLIYLTTANVYVLINYTAFNESLFIAFSVAALLWLRYKRPDMERPIKVNIFLPIFFFIVCIFLVLSPIFEKPVETGISALITLAGVPVYLVTVAWKNKPQYYNKINDCITRFLQVLLITIEEKKS